MTTTDYAAHVKELAHRFNVLLDMPDGMHPEEAGAGYILKRCPACSQANAFKRAGHLRCGRCKHDFGIVDRFLSVRVAPVTCEATYAIALHELGHCLHPTGRVNDSMGSRTMRRTGQVATLADMRHQLLEETSAWQWAITNALEWTPTMQQVMDLALGTYQQFAAQLGLRADGSPAWRRR